MIEDMPDERLEAVLASVGDYLVIPDTDEPHVVTPQRRPSRPGRMLMSAALVLVVALAATMAITPVGEAVADWLGLGATDIERVPADEGNPSGLSPIDAGLPLVSRPAAEALLGRQLPSIASPDLPAVDRIAVPPEGGILLVWDRGETTLWIRLTDDDPDRRVRKLLDDYDTLEPVYDLGEAAVLIEGEHVLSTPNRRLAADSVVLWLDDGVEYRLESNLGRAALLSIARSVHPQPPSRGTDAPPS